VLSSSTVAVDGGATLAVAPATQVAVQSISLATTGLVDVTSGGISIASGVTAAALVARIIEGRADGSWTGTSGITSSTAAADVAASIPRAVGWLDNGDGSVTAAFAAPGDTNIDWQVDVLDASNFLSFGKFDSGLPATWLEGDFNYDGVVDVLDAADFFGTGLYDAGSYNPSAGQGAASYGIGVRQNPVAAVPEPALSAGLAAVAWLVSARCCRRIRRTSAIVRG
jgi:hypothetical protein